MNTPITRRHALKTVAAVAVAPFAGGLAADSPAKIRIGQIGTSHAHAAGNSLSSIEVKSGKYIY